MQSRPRLACKTAGFCRQKYMQLAAKNTRNPRQNYLQLQAKRLAIAGKNTRICTQKYQKYAPLHLKITAIAGNTVVILRVKSSDNCRLECILQVKLIVNCVPN